MRIALLIARSQNYLRPRYENHDLPGYALWLSVVSHAALQWGIREYLSAQLLISLGSALLHKDSDSAVLQSIIRSTNRINNLLYSIYSLDRRSWSPSKTSRSGRIEETQALRAQWEQIFGKLDDPQVQERIQQIAAEYLRTA